MERASWAIRGYKKKRKGKARTACSNCRRAHAKCNKVQPCSRCIDRDLLCLILPYGKKPPNLPSSAQSYLKGSFSACPVSQPPPLLSAPPQVQSPPYDEWFTSHFLSDDGNDETDTMEDDEMGKPREGSGVIGKEKLFGGYDADFPVDYFGHERYLQQPDYEEEGDPFCTAGDLVRFGSWNSTQEPLGAYPPLTYLHNPLTPPPLSTDLELGLALAPSSQQPQVSFTEQLSSQTTSPPPLPFPLPPQLPQQEPALKRRKLSPQQQQQTPTLNNSSSFNQNQNQFEIFLQNETAREEHQRRVQQQQRKATRPFTGRFDLEGAPKHPHQHQPIPSYFNDYPDDPPEEPPAKQQTAPPEATQTPPFFS